MTKQEAEKYISDIPRFADKTGPENTRKLMEILGNPERDAKTVHIAGTDGKGSVAKMMSLMLEESGYKTGLFVSPHLVDINERISINGVNISDEDFGRIFDVVKDASDKLVEAGGSHPAYFEFLFAMGAVYFSEQKADYVVYETGMGGRLDATNCIQPCMTAITRIGFDHTQYLGDTIEEIAGEKAGIIKKGVPVVYCTGKTSANKVIEHVAREKGCPAFNAYWTEIIINSTEQGKIDFSLDNRYYTYNNLILNNGAVYQTRNASESVYMFDRLFHDMDIAEKSDIIHRALARFSMPGRFQYLKNNVILDGAHNPDACEEFVKALKKQYGNLRKLTVKLIFAVSSDKDYEKLIETLSSGIAPDMVYVTELESGRRLDSKVAGELFAKALGDKAEIVYSKSCVEAYKTAMENLQDEELLIITGSLYMAGEVLKIQ